MNSHGESAKSNEKIPKKGINKEQYIAPANYSNLIIEEVEVTEFLKQEDCKSKVFSNLTLEEVEVTEFVE